MGQSYGEVRESLAAWLALSKWGSDSVHATLCRCPGPSPAGFLLLFLPDTLLHPGFISAPFFLPFL